MTDPDLTMTVHHPEPGTAVIEINGEVTAACEPALMGAYEEASTRAPSSSSSTSTVSTT